MTFEIVIVCYLLLCATFSFIMYTMYKDWEDSMSEINLYYAIFGFVLTVLSLLTYWFTRDMKTVFTVKRTTAIPIITLGVEMFYCLIVGIGWYCPNILYRSLADMIICPFEYLSDKLEAKDNKENYG